MDPRVAWTVDQMQRQMADSLPLAALARSVNLSVSRFAHLFRREMGISPARHLRAIRLARARVLLERSFLSVHDVMRLVGYHDPSHFARDFRRVHGTSPMSLRGASMMNSRQPSMTATRR